MKTELKNCPRYKTTELTYKGKKVLNCSICPFKKGKKCTFNELQDEDTGRKFGAKEIVEVK